MGNTKFNLSEVLNFGWNKFKENAGFFIILMIVVGVINLILNLISNAAAGQSAFLGIVFSLITWVVSIFISMGLIRIALKFHDGQKGDFNDFKELTPYFLNYLIASILYSIMVGIGMFLLIIPGVYLAIKFFFYSYLIIDKNMGAVDALKGSYESTTGSFWDLLLIFVILVVINFIGALIFFVGLLVTVPVSIVAMAFVYRRLASESVAGEVQVTS